MKRKKGPPLDLRRRPMAVILEPDTPIGDMLYTITGGERCATFHGQPGGEWDSLRDVPLRVRQSLTTAGFFSRDGWKVDAFADLLLEYGGEQVDRNDPIDWYVRTAKRALEERRAAHRVGLRRALARANGHTTDFEYRDELARSKGFTSYYKYRIARGWGDGHGRRTA